MYNKPIRLTISSVTPKERSEDSQSAIDISLSCVVHGVKREVLDDIDFGDNKAGLGILLDSDLPIKYPVHLNYTERVDTEICSKDFAGAASAKDRKAKKAEKDEEVQKIPCALKEIHVFKPDSEGLMQLKLRIVLLDISAEDAGAIVSNLKKTIDLTIRTTQLEMFKQSSYINGGKNVKRICHKI